VLIFGPKGLADFLVGLNGWAPNQVYPIRNGRKNSWNYKFAGRFVAQPFKGFFNGARAARQVHDKAATSNNSRLAGQNGGGYKGKRNLPHLLAKAWQLSVCNIQSSLGGDVAWGGTGATRGEHQAATLVIAKLNQCLGNEGPLIGNEPFNGLPGRGYRPSQPGL
jgi:hypothetical protein